MSARREAGTAAVAAGDALRLLREGELDVVGRLVAASNATLYCTVRLDGTAASCVYKPIAGERPLWDFPDGTLAGREVAAYAVSQAAGWDLVPPTVMRDGPYGPGMCQLWIDVDETIDVLPLLRGSNPRLRAVALFDAVINNADRKGGHLLPAAGGRLYVVDHGVCFAVENKLRTLLWNWAGQPISEPEIGILGQLRGELADSLGTSLRALLAPAEVDTTIDRLDRLVAAGAFPEPSADWPAVPWPPF